MRKFLFRRNHTFYDVLASSIGTVVTIEYGWWYGVAALVGMAVIGVMLND